MIFWLIVLCIGLFLYNLINMVYLYAATREARTAQTLFDELHKRYEEQSKHVETLQAAQKSSAEVRGKQTTKVVRLTQELESLKVDHEVLRDERDELIKEIRSLQELHKFTTEQRLYKLRMLSTRLQGINTEIASLSTSFEVDLSNFKCSDDSDQQPHPEEDR